MLNPHQTEQTRSQRVSLWPRKDEKKRSISPRIHLQTERFSFVSFCMCWVRASEAEAMLQFHRSQSVISLLFKLKAHSLNLKTTNRPQSIPFNCCDRE